MIIPKELFSNSSCKKIFTIFTQKQSPEAFYKKAVLKNFKIFTGEHLC